MKNKLTIILTVAISVLAIAFIAYAVNLFPTTLNDWDDGDIIESGWADSVEDAIGVTGSLVQTSLDWKVRRARSFDIRVSGGSFARVSSLSFDAGMFNISNTASRSDITIDWGSGGPASLSQAETVNSLWTFSVGASLTTNFEVAGYASVAGNFNFFGEIRPDGVTCAANDVLKRTGADDWDCATDATGSTASNSLNFDEFQNPLVLDLAITVTSGAFTWDWNGTKLIDINTASTTETFELGAGAGTTGAVKLGDAGVQIGHDGDGMIIFLGLGNGTDEDLRLNLDDVSNEATLTTSTGVTRFLFSGINVSTSLSFEAVGTASASLFDGTAFAAIDCNDAAEGLQWSAGIFSCRAWVDADIPDGITVSGGTIGANNISGTQTTTGTLTLGDGGDDIVISSNDWAVSAAGVFSGLTGITSSGAALFTGSLDIPSSAGGSLVDAEGEITLNTSSSSFNFYDGTAERVLRDRECKTWAYETPTARDEWGSVFFDDPVTITDVTAIASRSSNAVGWNMAHGRTGSVLGTNLFAANKSASSTFTYDSTFFSDATLTNSEFLVLRITSSSATVEELDVTVCYRLDAP